MEELRAACLGEDNVRYLSVIAILLCGSCASGLALQAKGVPIVTPIDLVSPATVGISGTLAPDDVIVAGVVRPRHAAIADQEIANPYRSVPARLPLIASVIGAEAGLTGLPDQMDQIVWCDSRTAGVFDTVIACFRDRDGDNAFDQLFAVPRADQRSALGWSYAIPVGDLSPIVPYRGASESELPEKTIGYRLCNNAGSTPRFGSVVRKEDGSWPSVVSCIFGERNDGNQIKVDLLVIEAAPAPDNKLSYKIVNAPQRAALFVDSLDGPFQLAASARSEGERALDRLKEFAAQPSLVSRGAGTVRAIGPVSKGDVLISIPVRHGLTGRLRSEVKALGVFAMGAKVEAGASVYGVPLTGRVVEGDNDFTWCAPKAVNNSGRARWSTVCFPSGTQGMAYWATSDDLLVRSLQFGGSASSGANLPDIERGSADIGMQLVLELAFAGWENSDAKFEWRLSDAGGQTQILNTLRAVEDGNRNAALRISAIGVTVTLSRPSANGGSAYLTSIDPALALSDGDRAF